jgi:hypothetical protein
MTPTQQTPHPSQVETIRGVLKYYKATSYITGTFLLLLVVEVIVRWGLGYDLIAGGPQGFLHLYERGLNGQGLPDSGLNLSTAVLIVHGWLYVAYLFGDFRLWTLMRWSFFRFLIIALGGIVPLLSFFTEHHFAKVAEADLKKVA